MATRSLVLLALLAGLGSFGGETGGARVIRLGHIGYPDSSYDLAARKFKELREARLPGRVEVRTFDSAQLGEDREMLVFCAGYGNMKTQDVLQPRAIAVRATLSEGSLPRPP